MTVDKLIRFTCDECGVAREFPEWVSGVAGRYCVPEGWNWLNSETLLCDKHAVEVVDREAAVGGTPSTVTHQCPTTANRGIMPCCGKAMSEAVGDWVTDSHAEVTCGKSSESLRRCPTCSLQRGHSGECEKEKPQSEAEFFFGGE